MKTAAVGFRVKTGWAAAALVLRTPAAPVLLDVSRVELYDKNVKDSGWPFHAGLELPKDEARRVTSRLVKIVEGTSKKALGNLLKRYKEEGGRLLCVGIVVGSQVDPATISNDHIRAHAEEGRLYRSVVLEAAKSVGLKTAIFLEKELYETASDLLGRPVKELKKEIVALGRDVEGPWRAEQKAAALAALIAVK